MYSSGISIRDAVPTADRSCGLITNHPAGYLMVPFGACPQRKHGPLRHTVPRGAVPDGGRRVGGGVQGEKGGEGMGGGEGVSSAGRASAPNTHHHPSRIGGVITKGAAGDPGGWPGGSEYKSGKARKDSTRGSSRALDGDPSHKLNYGHNPLGVEEEF